MRISKKKSFIALTGAVLRPDTGADTWRSSSIKLIQRTSEEIKKTRNPAYKLLLP